MRKENKVIKPINLPIEFIDKVTRLYGPVDFQNDFFSSDLKTYFKTVQIIPERNYSEHDVIKLE